MKSATSFKNYFDTLPATLKEVVVLIRHHTRENHTHAYVVGGCVRDFLLGVNNFDLDIVVEREGIAFAAQLAGELGATMVKHRAFGTATITTNDGFKVDIATCRKEFYPHPAALPVVSGGTIAEDLFRRDFTINAMAFHIDDERHGEFVDLNGGLKDVQRGLIRCLHEKSFIDDPTRIIRGVRFEQRFGFRFEPKTVALIQEAKKICMLEQVHPHRLRDEWILLLKEKNPYRVLRRLGTVYGFNFIDSKLTVARSVEKKFKAIDPTVAWFEKEFPQRRRIDRWLMVIALFLSPLTTAHIKKLLSVFAFKAGEIKRIVSFKLAQKRIEKVFSQRKVSAARIHSLLDPLSYEAILLVASVAKNKKVQQRIKEFFFEHHAKRLSITGDDLLKLGMRSGPGMKVLLGETLKAKINGAIFGRSEELAFARKLIKRYNQLRT